MSTRRDHFPECPQGRHRDDLCICDLLRTVRSAARAEREDRAEEDRRESRMPE